MKRFKVWSFLLVCCLLSCATQTEQAVDEDLDPGDLSTLQATLKRGMTRAEVIGVLGKPTWAAIPGDMGDYGIRDAKTGLILFWRNPGLAVVEVHFDKDYKTRFDGGIPLNSASYTHMFEPPVSYQCDKPDRNDYCQ